jgi:CspA family cold shock protein
MTQQSGIVKWFDDTRRFGFVVDTHERQYFAHAKNIQTGEKTLIQGQRVTFLAVTSPKGPQAHEIGVIEVDGNTLEK